MTSLASLNCGMARGLTNDVASTTGKPASASIVMNCIFCSVGTSAFSFCSPSRGPTSTTRTKEGKGSETSCHTSRSSILVVRGRFETVILSYPHLRLCGGGSKKGPECCSSAPLLLLQPICFFCMRSTRTCVIRRPAWSRTVKVRSLNVTVSPTLGILSSWA